MSRFDPTKPVVATTVVWQRMEHGWDSFLIREQPNGPPNMTKLTTVRVHVPVCLACLSNNVTVMDSEQYEDGELVCHECGVKYGFVM